MYLQCISVWENVAIKQPSYEGSRSHGGFLVDRCNPSKFTLQVSDGFGPEVSISPLLVQLGLQHRQLLLQLHPVLFQLATPLLRLPQAGLQALSLFLRLRLTLLQPGCRLLFRLQPGVGLVELQDG